MDPIEVYRQKVSLLPDLDDSWFGQALAAARAGDDEARRRISGSSLRVALAATERRVLVGDLLDSVQEANAAIHEAIDTFASDTVADYCTHLEERVSRRLDQTCSA